MIIMFLLIAAAVVVVAPTVRAVGRPDIPRLTLGQRWESWCEDRARATALAQGMRWADDPVIADSGDPTGYDAFAAGVVLPFTPHPDERDERLADTAAFAAVGAEAPWRRQVRIGLKAASAPGPEPKPDPHLEDTFWGKWHPWKVGV